MSTKKLLLLLFVALYACNKNNTTTPINNNIVKDKDGNIYTTIDIGNQRWLVQNLRTTHYNNGDTIRHITDNTAWGNTYMDAQNKKDSGAWCYYGNNVDTGKLFGCLYNYYAVVDPRGIAPQGYHVADTTDYNILIKNLGGYITAGSLLKDTTTNQPQSWQPPNPNASNIFGFTALPAGFRADNGRSLYLGTVAYFGTQTSASTFNSYLLGLNNNNGITWKYPNDSKANGYSIRCVKNIK